MLQTVEFAVAALACIILAALVERRTGVPPAVLQVLVGLVYGLLPGPNLTLDPDVVLVLVIPLLLYSAALNASLQEIRANLRPVLSLSVVLVVLTTLAVGLSVAAVVPGVPLAAAVALGAAVAPPDPVAALAVGRRAGLSSHLTSLIEGEGLLNDATALTAFEVAVGVALGSGFSVAAAGGRFAYAAVGGALVGLAVAWLIRLVRRHLDEPVIENALSLATPFLAYVPAESLHVSGILAVVVAGLWLGHQAPVLLSGPSRLQIRAVWRVVDFLLEGFVFLLIGDQLPVVIAALQAYPLPVVLGAALATVAAVLLVRPVWLVLSFWLVDGRWRGPGATARPAGGELLALTWAGTRGVISLAAVVSLPVSFPFRDLLLLCAYSVVLVTLVGQGLSFGPLLRALGLRPERAEEVQQWAMARTAAIAAGLRRLDELTDDQPALAAAAVRLRQRAAERQELGDEWLRRLTADAIGLEEEDEDGPAIQSVRLRREMIAAERDELLRWRAAGRLPDAGLRAAERELDHEEDILP